MVLNGIENPDRICAGQALRVEKGSQNQFTQKTIQPTIEETVSSLTITPKKSEGLEFFTEEVDDSIFDVMDFEVETTASENAASDTLLDSSIFDSADDIELVPVDFSAGIDL